MPTTRLKKYPDEITLADDFARCPEGKKRNQYQQHDNTGGNHLVHGAAAEVGERCRDAAVTEGPDNNFLETIEDDQHARKLRDL